MDYESKVHFSNEDSDVELLREIDGEDRELSYSRKKSWLRRLGLAALVHIVIWSLYSLIFFLALRNLWSHLPAYIDCEFNVPRYGTSFNKQLAPATNVLKPETIVFDIPSHYPQKYFGHPSDEIDQAWHELLDHGTVKFTANQMRAYGREHEGVQLTDGSGYMGTLNVWHELHCLKRLYQNMFVDHYFPNMTKTEWDFNLHHNFHCLDIIRQGVQCRVDVSPLTFRWGELQVIPIANFSSPHSCANWDAFMDWSKDNTFNPFEPGLIVHPKYGPPYTDENRNRIGVAKDH